MEEKEIYKNRFAHIDKVGLELEGGWEKTPTYSIASDGSVHCNGNVLGEARTTPQETLKGVFNEINTKYPDDIDQSCGMHIHISVKDGLYYLLADSKFRDYFLYRMGLLGKYLRHSGNETDYKRFLKRFNNSNQYCKRDFIPGKQLRNGDGRRTMLNFCAYRNHKTIECRLLPMFEKLSNARMAAYEVIDTFETFLSTAKIDTGEVVTEIEIPAYHLRSERVSLEVICA